MFPKKADSEVNLSMVWCLLAIGFAYKILASLTGLYFEGDDGTETNFMQLVLVLNFFVPLSTFRGWALVSDCDGVCLPLCLDDGPHRIWGRFGIRIRSGLCGFQQLGCRISGRQRRTGFSGTYLTIILCQSIDSQVTFWNVFRVRPQNWC